MKVTPKHWTSLSGVLFKAQRIAPDGAAFGG